MKRFTITLGVALLMLVSNAPCAFGDELTPIDPNGPYRDAWGIATATYIKYTDRTDYPRQQQRVDIWIDGYFEGLAPNGHYILLCYTNERAVLLGHAFFASGDGTADWTWVSAGWFAKGLRRIAYFELWTARVDYPGGPVVLVDPVLSSR